MSLLRWMVLAPLVSVLSLAMLWADDKKVPTDIPPKGNNTHANLSDEEVLKRAGIATDAPGLVEFFKKATLDEKDLETIARLIQLLGDDDFAVREKATRELVAQGHKAQPQLRKARESKDRETAVRASQCLGQLGDDNTARLAIPAARLLAARKPAGAASVLLKFLPRAESVSIEEDVIAALAVVGVKEGKPDADLAAAVKDSKGICRAAAARVLGKLDDPELRNAVRSLLKDDDIKVQFHAAYGLVAGKDREAIPTLIALLSDAPRGIALRSEGVLCFLAGEKSPPVSMGTTDADRKKCRDAWEAWWKEHANKVDLAAIDLEKGSVGNVLVCVHGLNKDGDDKVIELGAEGKPRWEVKDLRRPTDAQVLPGNRILIAEFDGRKATEREIGGKVVWEFQFKYEDPVVACQRLPNGNTFIAGYSHWICELTPEKKEVYRFKCDANFHGWGFCHARKLRNGSIAVVCLNVKQSALALIDEKGNVKKWCPVGETVGCWMSVDELPSGGVLVASEGKLTEFDLDGKEVFSLKIPNALAVAACRLPNGTYMVSDYEGRVLRQVDRTGKELIRYPLNGRPGWVKGR